MTDGIGVTLNGKHIPLEQVYIMPEKAFDKIEAGLKDALEIARGGKQLPLYTCHKQVRALEIRTIGAYSYEPSPEARLVREVVFADPAYPPLKLDESLFARYVPMPGDYYVVYEDGYQSFSPRKAFLEGYSLRQRWQCADGAPQRRCHGWPRRRTVMAAGHGLVPATRPRRPRGPRHHQQPEGRDRALARHPAASACAVQTSSTLAVARASSSICRTKAGSRMSNIYPGALREMAELIARSDNPEVRFYVAEVMRRAATEIERLSGESAPPFDEFVKTLKETKT
jgi:hypothetical protein